MSAEIPVPLEQIGLPLPTEEEWNLLRVGLGDQPLYGQPDPVELAGLIIDRTQTGDIIEHDVNQFVSYEAADLHLLQEELLEFCSGIEEGYSFIIGCISYIHYFRSDHANFSDYLVAARYMPGHLPAATSLEVDRIKLVRTGEALIDTGAYGDAFSTSKDLAQWAEQDYFNDSSFMEELLQSEYLRLGESLESADSMGTDESESDVTTTNHTIDGFNHGVRNALMMYIQSKEASVLGALDFKVS